MLVPPRSHDAEWMDRTGNAGADLGRALADIEKVNRFLGGSRAILRALDPWLVRTGSFDAPLEILDVGTGGADLPVRMALRGRRRGRRVRVTAVDRDPRTVRLAAGAAAGIPEIRLVRADALSLPFAPGSFDVVTASMFLHHFREGQVCRLLADFRRLARRAVLVNDLRRHRIPWAFIAVAARLTGRHPMFVHDAPLSVLRGFTADELRRVARAAGAPSARLERSWPFRLVLTLPGGAP